MVLQFSLNRLDEAKLLTCIHIKSCHAFRTQPKQSTRFISLELCFLRKIDTLRTATLGSFKRCGYLPASLGMTTQAGFDGILTRTDCLFFFFFETDGSSNKTLASAGSWSWARPQSVLTCWCLLEFLWYPVKPSCSNWCPEWKCDHRLKMSRQFPQYQHGSDCPMEE